MEQEVGTHYCDKHGYYMVLSIKGAAMTALFANTGDTGEGFSKDESYITTISNTGGGSNCFIVDEFEFMSIMRNRSTPIDFTMDGYGNCLLLYSKVSC